MIRTLRAAVAVTALGAVHPAFAAPAPAKDASLGRKETVAPDAALAGSLPGVKAQAAGPQLGYDTFRYAVEVQVSGKRREEIADLEKLIGLGGSKAELPQWLFRVAELHWEESQYFFFEANRKDDAIAAAKGDAARVEQLRAERKELERRSRDEQGRAIDRYREIMQKYPKYPRLDEVFFFLGENLWKQNRRKEALASYKLLITRYPKSRYVPDAWMAFGEHYFDSAEKGDRKQNLKSALESYKRAAAYTESSVYGYSLYKQGWVHYNLAAWAEALELFRAVIFFGELPTSTVAPDKKLALVREARKDYVRTYSHVGSPRGAYDEFTRVGGKDARDMLKSLAGLYFDEGKDREAILVYHQLIVTAPDAPDATQFQARIVTCAGRIGKKELAVQQAGRFVEMLRDAEKRGGDEIARRAVVDARKDAENTLRTLAVQYHAEFKKTKEPAVAALAAELYRMYLDVFPDSKQRYEIRFFHAELLYALEKFGEAGEEYGRVAQIDLDRMKERGPDGAPLKPGKYFADALESAVRAYDVVARKAEATEARPASDPHTRLPIPREKQLLLDASNRYLKYVPNGDKVVEVAYKAANVYYRYNAFPEAVELFARIARQHPKHELARYAANLALDSYNLLGDWKGMNEWAKRFRADAELMRAQPALRDDLEKVIEQSSFKLVEELERGNRHADAAAAYLAFVRDWPGSKLAPTALFNASVDLVRAGRLEQAMNVREQLAARYPNDPLIPKVIFTEAQDREAIADFERAADAYEQYFHAWRKAATAASPAAPRPKRARPTLVGARPVSGDAGGYEEAKARDALYNAGVLREGLAQLRRAEADRTLFVETFPRAQETPKVFLSIADLHRRERAWSKEIRQLEEYQERWAAHDPTEWLVIQDRIAKAYRRAGNTTAERRTYEAALSYWHARRSRVADRGLPVVAQAQYLALEPAFAQYDAIDFRVPARYSAQRQVKWLKEQAEAKGRRLVELQKHYTAVVNLKQAEPAVCALYKIGLGYQRFAQAFQRAPVPPELRRDPALAKEYKAQLAQLAEAPEKKAVEALEYALSKSRELGVSNACSRAAADILVKVKPDQYGPVLEKVPELGRPERASAGEGRGLLHALWVAPSRPTAAPPQVLPALRTPSSTVTATPGRDPDLPPERVPPPRPRSTRDVNAPLDDEDLLP